MTKFIAEILDINGNYTVADGPLANIQSVTITKQIDAAGEFSCVLPGIDTRVIDYVSSQRHIRILAESNTTGTLSEIAEGIINSIAKTNAGGQILFTLTGLDRLGELNYINTGNRLYDNDTISNIIGTSASGTGLLVDTGWSQGTVTPSIASTTIEYKAQKILSALTTLATQTGDHFRENADTKRTLDYGTFGSDSGVILRNVHQPLISQKNLDYGIIGGLQLNVISSEIQNRLYPIGKNDFDMRDIPTTITDIKVTASRGPNGATTTTNAASSGTVLNVASTTDFVAGSEVWIGDADDWTQDHEVGYIESIGAGVLNLHQDMVNSYASGADVLQAPQFYIEDTTSIATYGLREAIPVFSWITPIPSGVFYEVKKGDAEALYYAAKAQLQRYAEPYESLVISDAYNVPYSLQVGDTARVIFKGLVNVLGETTYLDIDEDYYILKITRTFDGTGSMITSLEVANIDRPTPNNLSLWVYNLNSFNWIAPGR